MGYNTFFALIVSAIISCSAGELHITGHEEPLIIGISRDISCSWNGSEDARVTKMEWFLVGLGNGDAIESVTGESAILLSLNPGNAGLDGTMYTCKATLSTGPAVEQSITLSVKALSNTVSVSTMSALPTAGESYSLFCNVSSERESNVTWVDPNGVEILDTHGGADLMYSGWYGGESTLVLTIHSIHTSQSGTYKCISQIDVPPSVTEATVLVRVEIPEPTVTIRRNPDDPVQLYTADSMVLTCEIELIPEVDSYVTVNTQWRGHSSLTDSQRRVIVSELEGIQLTYNTSVTFSVLKTADSGSYVCSAIVSPGERNSNLITSDRTQDTITISVALKVTIGVTYNPPSDFDLASPPYYRPASPVTLTCRAHHASGSVTYQWSSTCSSCFAQSGTSQSVSKTTLTSIDAGVHTCTARDSSGNSGSNSTEMKLIGSGIYVERSYYIRNRAVANNSYIVRGRSSLYYISVYCYSNSTTSRRAYMRFPDGSLEYSDSRHHYYTVQQQSYSGVRLSRYSSSYYPSIYGIFTCEVPDSRGVTVDTSIGIYSSIPSAPSVYSINYAARGGSNDGILGAVDCFSQNSPPTIMIWTRDGRTIDINGEDYDMAQTVMERRSYFRYKNTLLIKSVVQLAGNHRFCCSVSNDAGTSSSRCVSTTWNAQPEIRFSATGKAVDSEPYQAQCIASIPNVFTANLMQYLSVEWVGPDGQQIHSERDGITVAVPRNVIPYSLSKSIIFDPLKMKHGGNYTCKAKVVLPGSGGNYQSTSQYQLIVRNMTIIQLKFGPVVHCSKWYEDKNMSRHLELDIKRTLTNLINKNCTCDFRVSEIDEGEFGCRSTESGYVIYRARLTGRSDTQDLPSLLEVINNWKTNDGTFLYTYNGRMRLGLDTHCPLEITSFSQPECAK